MQLNLPTIAGIALIVACIAVTLDRVHAIYDRCCSSSAAVAQAPPAPQAQSKGLPKGQNK
jgi:hypothetical protein